MTFLRAMVLFCLVFSSAVFADDCVDYSGTYQTPSAEKVIIQQVSCDTVVLDYFRASGTQYDRRAGYTRGAHNMICSFPLPSCRPGQICSICAGGFARMFHLLPTGELQIIEDSEYEILMRSLGSSTAQPIAERELYQFTDASRTELAISIFKKEVQISTETWKRVP